MLSSSFHLDAAVAEQRTGRTSKFSERLSVVGQRGGFGHLREREIVLPREHEEVGGGADAEAILLRAQLDFGGGEPRSGGLNAADGGVERGRRILHFDGDLLLRLCLRQQRLPSIGFRFAQSSACFVPPDWHLKRDADGRVGKLLRRRRVP